MAVTYSNECVDCATPGYPCMGSSCPNRRVPHYFCDECGGEFDADELYQYDEDTMLCEEHLLEKFEKVSEKES